MEVVYAVHNFEAENPDEIAFRIGDPITVIEKDEKFLDGWWQGRNIRGEIGLFPMNYTSYEKPIDLDTAPHTPQPSHMRKQQPPPHNNDLESQIDHAITQIKVLPSSDVFPQTQSSRSTPTTSSSTKKASLQKKKKKSRAGSLTKSSSASHLPTQSIFLDGRRPPEEWNVQQVGEWLTSVGLDSVVPNFIGQEISGDILVDLTIDALKELDINTYGKRYKIMTAISALKDEVSRQEGGGGSIHSLSDEDSKASTQDDIVAAAAAPKSNSNHSTLLAKSSSSVPSLAKHMGNGERSRSPNNKMMAAAAQSISIPTALDEFTFQQQGPPRRAPAPPTNAQSPEPSISADSQQSRDLRFGGSNKGFLSDDHVSEYSTSRLSPSNRPLSPQSTGTAPSVTRSNTFNTVSSKQSISTIGSNGTNFSGDRSTMPTYGKHTVIPRPNPTNHSMSDLWADNSDKQQSLLERSPSDGINGTRNRYDMNKHSQPPHGIRGPEGQVMHRPSVDTQRFPLPEPGQLPEKEGWLHKQSDKYKTWNRRWFVLKGPNLFYFKNPRDVRMKGIINLRGYKISIDEDISPGKYCFKAKHERERTFFFYTDSDTDLREWVKALMKATISRDFTAPVMSSNHVATVSLEAARKMRPRPPSMILYKKNELRNGQDNKLGQSMLSPPLMEEGEDPMSAHAPPKLSMRQKTPSQTRESGITVHHNIMLHESDVPALPHHSAEKQWFNGNDSNMQQNSPMYSLSNDDEDLIDPHHDRVSANASNGQSLGSWTPQEYVTWINSHLPPGKQVIDLSNAFRNGDTLIQLLQQLSGKEVRRPPPQKGGSVSMAMLDNIVAAFKFMGREGVVVDGRYTIKDVFGGNETKIMEMLDAIRAWADEMGYEKSNTLRIQQYDAQSGRKSPRVGTGGTFGDEDDKVKESLRMIESEDED